MKHRGLLCVALGALLLGIVQQASASLLSTNLQYGVENFLQDNSVAYLSDANGNPISLTPSSVIGVGSDLVGVIRIVQNTTTGVTISPTLGELDVAFALQITGTHSGGSVAGLPSNYIGFDVSAAPGLLQVLLPSYSSGMTSNSAFAVIGGNVGTTDITTVGPSSAFATLNTTLTHQLNLVGQLSPSNSNNFFQAMAMDRDGNGVINPLGDYLTSSSTLSSLVGSTTQIGGEAAGFTVQNNPLGPLTNVPVTPLFTANGYNINLNELSQIGLTSNLYAPSQTQLTNGWDFSDQSFVTLAPSAVPEPTSLVVWSLVLASAAGFGFRGRRSRKTA